MTLSSDEMRRLNDAFYAAIFNMMCGSAPDMNFEISSTRS